MKIIPLNEGCFTIDQTKEFVPFNKEKDDLQKRSRGSLLVEIQPFVVITKKDIILLDCGLGFSNENDILQIHQNLINFNIDPMSITKVLISHLHKDHAGGLCKEDKILNKTFLSFPNATYYISKEEIHLAQKSTSSSYKPVQLSILSQTDNVIYLEEKGQIDNYITYNTTAAHSLFHVVFWIKEDNEIVFYGADDAPQLQQMKTKFVAKYDFDGKKSMQLRSEWWELGQKEKWTFLFYHDINTPSFNP